MRRILDEEKVNKNACKFSSTSSSLILNPVIDCRLLELSLVLAGVLVSSLYFSSVCFIGQKFGIIKGVSSPKN